MSMERNWDRARHVVKSGQVFVCITVLFAGLLAGNSTANESPVATLKIDGLFQNDGQGLYDRVFSTVQKQAGGFFQSQTLALNRAFKDFETGKVACLSPANTNANFYQFAFPTTQSRPMSTAMIFVFTKAGTASISDLSALQGKKIGIRSGMPYGNEIEDAGFTLVEARTIEANAKKLNAGRIDAFLAYVPDVYAAFDAMGIDKLPHAVEAPIAVHEDAILCRNDKGGEDIVAKFNSALNALEKNGELKRILE